ncbi:unnamed protein product [Dovyalis caffra]|uniref:Uncharacterized protein n=1 Tax=Dovyalis caffra TaxID=77055 RepID=A0AAV1RSS4_9ROSI|nr:unnamed protein product [Dovyalis caffra]
MLSLKGRTRRKKACGFFEGIEKRIVNEDYDADTEEEDDKDVKKYGYCKGFDSSTRGLAIDEMRRIFYAYKDQSTTNGSYEVKLFQCFRDSAMCICGSELGIQGKDRGSVSEEIS